MLSRGRRAARYHGPVAKLGDHQQVIWCAQLGLVGYPRALALQKSLRRARLTNEVPDLLLLLEHPPTYTRGRRSGPSELPLDEDWYHERGIEIHATDRGGRVTYHGPGQLVAYPIVQLGSAGLDVVRYIRLLEKTVIATVSRFGVRATVNPNLTGVWVDDRKIASIGIHVSRGITTHGVAINLDNDLEPFSWIVPCGIEGCRVTSVAAECGPRRELEMDELKTAFAGELASRLGRRPIEVQRARLESLRTAQPVPA